MRSAQIAGLAMIAGAAGLGVWWIATDQGNPFAQRATGVSTRAGGTPGTQSRAEILQELRSELAYIETQLEAERVELASDYQQRKTAASFDHPEVKARVEARCTTHCWFGIDPWCGCDDQILREYKAEIEQWYATQKRLRLAPLEASREQIKAEIDALLLTAT